MSDPFDVDVVIIGAGFSGLTAYDKTTLVGFKPIALTGLSMLDVSSTK